MISYGCRKLHSLVVSALIVALVHSTILAQGRPLALTTRGPVSGLVTRAGIHAFLGIPYAAPPEWSGGGCSPVLREDGFASLGARQFGTLFPELLVLVGRATLSE